MAINFPNSPTLNEEFTAGDRTWIWDGTVWNSKETAFTTPGIPTGGATAQLLAKVDGADYNTEWKTSDGVRSFADASARATAIPSPVEGMTTFLEDSNLLEMYDGSSYKQISGLTGGILQVVTGTTSTSISTTSTSFVDSGLTATITPKRATSKVLVLTHQNHQVAKDGVQEVRMESQLLRGATMLDKARIAYLDTGQSVYRDLVQNISYCVVDSPNTTSATIYKTQHRSVDSGMGTSTQYNNYPSHITLIELAG